MSLLKHEINKSIRDETSLGMKPKLLYNKHFQKIKNIVLVINQLEFK